MGASRALATIFGFFAVFVVRRFGITAAGRPSQRIVLRGFCSAVVLSVTLLMAVGPARASSTFAEYEGRLITAVEISFEGSPVDRMAEAEFLSILRVVPNTQFSAVAIRDSLQALFDSERVANARVEGFEAG